jgi:two-component system, OmpR family, sensor histidine kinase VicK
MLANLEIIENPKESVDRAYDISISARKELFVAFPTVNSFQRNVRTAMSVLLLKKEYSEDNFTLRILTPVDNQIVPIVKELKTALPQLDIRAINENTESNRVIIVLADRKESLIIEIKDNTKDNMYEAAGPSIYSNNQPIVLSYIAIFETLWKQSQALVQL